MKKISICLIISVTCLLFAFSMPVWALNPGNTIPTQMLSFNDPLSGKAVKRLTTMGKEASVQVYIEDMSSEGTNWSPDSQYIAFCMRGHPDYPNGVYNVNVNNGTIRYLAPCGDEVTPTTYNKANANEILYFYSYKPADVSSRWVELRAVNVSTYAVRVIKRYSQAWRGWFANQSYDGKWLFFVLWHGPDQSDWLNIYKDSVMVNLSTGADHPLFTYSTGDTTTGNCDGAYWNPVNKNMVLAIGGYYNVDTSTSTTLTMYTAHSTWHPNGNWIVCTKGMRDSGNNLLTPTYDLTYGTCGHPFANPTQASLGWDAKVVCDYTGAGAVLVEVPWSTLRDVPFATWKNNASLRIGAWYGNTNGVCHPHPQYSPDGSKVCWVSNIAVTGTYGAPPGPNDGLETSCDLFVITLGSTPAPTPTPTSAPTTTPTPGATPTPVPGGLITNLTVNDTVNAADWSIQSNIQTGDTEYGDRAYTFTSVPASVAGCSWIRTACDSKTYIGATLCTFTVSQNADVYVASDDRISTKPSWMSGWTDTGDNLVDNQGSPMTFSLYKKSYTAGSTVSLGNNGHTTYCQYTVIVKSTGGAAPAVINDNTTGTGNSQFEYVGTWGYNSSSPNAYQQDEHYSRTTNSYYQVDFNGTRIKVYGPKDTNMGKEAFSIDGGAETIVDCYSSARQEQVLLYDSSTLTAGQHTLKMRVTGTKNAGSSDAWTSADRVDITN